MLNRKDYRKYWIKSNYFHEYVCSHCDLKIKKMDGLGCSAVGNTEFDCNQYRFMFGSPYTPVFKLIKKDKDNA